MMPCCHRAAIRAVVCQSRKPITVSRTFHVVSGVFTIVLDLSHSFTEESLGYVPLGSCQTVISPHPDPLPRGEGTAAASHVFCRHCFGKLRRRYNRETADHSPSPQGRGPW